MAMSGSGRNNRDAKAAPMNTADIRRLLIGEEPPPPPTAEDKAAFSHTLNLLMAHPFAHPLVPAQHANAREEQLPEAIWQKKPVSRPGRY